MDSLKLDLGKVRFLWVPELHWTRTVIQLKYYFRLAWGPSIGQRYEKSWIGSTLGKLIINNDYKRRTSFIKGYCRVFYFVLQSISHSYGLFRDHLWLPPWRSCCPLLCTFLFQERVSDSHERKWKEKEGAGKGKVPGREMHVSEDR